MSCDARIASSVLGRTWRNIRRTTSDKAPGPAAFVNMVRNVARMLRVFRFRRHKGGFTAERGQRSPLINYQHLVNKIVQEAVAKKNDHC
jgi:hypothetical protein